MDDPPLSDEQLEQPTAAVDKPPAAPLTSEHEEAVEMGEGMEEEEYVRDPDDAPLFAMRYQEASDDEGSKEGRRPPRARIGPDHDDNSQYSLEVYEDEVDDEEDDEEYYDDLEEEDVGEGFKEEYDGRRCRLRRPPAANGTRTRRLGRRELSRRSGRGEGEREPFAVPTSGIFYMHDECFQDDGRG